MRSSKNCNICMDLSQGSFALSLWHHLANQDHHSSYLKQPLPLLLLQLHHLGHPSCAIASLCQTYICRLHPSIFWARSRFPLIAVFLFYCGFSRPFNTSYECSLTVWIRRQKVRDRSLQVAPVLDGMSSHTTDNLNVSLPINQAISHAKSVIKSLQTVNEKW